MTEEEMAAVLDTIRRQGRAAIAAQAAAESCLEAIHELDNAARTPAPDGASELLSCLLPAVDSLHRVAAEARRINDSLRGLLVRWVDPGRARRIAALIEGVRLLEVQFEGALRSAGVTIDREVSVPVDAMRHRVVSVRRSRARAGHVIEVLRAGYRLGERVVRETEVVAAVED